MILALRLLELKCRHNFTNNAYTDILDLIGGEGDSEKTEKTTLYLAKGKLKELVEEGFFADERDIALIGSTDGYQIFRQKTDDCWIVMFINANLSPDIRVKKENLLVSAVIPGPNQPQDFNSFLRPIIDELKLLQGKLINSIIYIIYLIKFNKLTYNIYFRRCTCL